MTSYARAARESYMTKPVPGRVGDLIPIESRIHARYPGEAGSVRVEFMAEATGGVFMVVNNASAHTDSHETRCPTHAAITVNEFSPDEADAVADQLKKAAEAVRERRAK